MSKSDTRRIRWMKPERRSFATGLGALADRRPNRLEAAARIALIFLVVTAADSTCSLGQTVRSKAATIEREQISGYRARAVQGQDRRIAAIKERLKSPKDRYQSSADFRRQRAKRRKEIASFEGKQPHELFLGSGSPLALGSLGRLETCRVIQVDPNGEMLVIQRSKLAEEEASRGVAVTGRTSLRGAHRRIQNATIRRENQQRRRESQNIFLVPLHLHGEGLWIRGLNNLNLSEGERLTIPGLMLVSDRKAWSAVIAGTKTVFVLEPFDETPYLPKYGAEAQQAPYMGSRKLKLFHESACSSGKKITDADLIGFDTEIDARYYGYRPGRCLR
ncbi:MAG: hypothetical protein V3W34_14165 [Phycisphaerae bacterium]